MQHDICDNQNKIKTLFLCESKENRIRYNKFLTFLLVDVF